MKDLLSRPTTRIIALCLAAVTTIAIGIGVMSAQGGSTPEPSQVALESEATLAPNEEPMPVDPAARNPTALEIKSQIDDAAGRTAGGLHVAANDCKPQCQQTPEYFTENVEGMLRLCDKMPIEEIPQAPTYDPKVHEPVLGAYTAACLMLSEARSTLGSPVRSAAWLSTIEVAASVLEGALAVDRAKATSGR